MKTVEFGQLTPLTVIVVAPTDVPCVEEVPRHGRGPRRVDAHVQTPCAVLTPNKQLVREAVMQAETPALLRSSTRTLLQVRRVRVTVPTQLAPTNRERPL